MGPAESSLTGEQVDEIIADWPDDPEEVARGIVDEYGPPDEATPSRLIWFDNGPWKRSVLKRDGTPHEFPKEHTDLFTQTIDYEVSPEHYDALGRFDGSVTVRRTEGELSATCHGEAANFLALNLAHDIVTGERSVEEAREFYAEAVARKDAGDPPEYMQEFQFDLPESDQGDPDESVITEEMRREADQQAQGAEGE